MKRMKRILLTIILSLSLTAVAPDFITLQLHIPTVTYVQAKTTYVYVTLTGKKYHSHKCGNGKYTKTTLKKAKARGLTPCKKCYG